MKNELQAQRSSSSIHRNLKILMLHNRYQYGGGEDISTSQEVNMLQEMGQNIELVEWSNDRIKDFSRVEKASLFFSASWNRNSASWLTSKLSSQPPDVMHVQNFFPLFSPSVHKAAQKTGVPTVQHLRNFRLGCLNSYLFREGKVCEACVGKSPWRGVLRRCYKDSLPASLSLWQMITSNRLLKTWEQCVDAFIVPSQFAANKVIELGVPSDLIHVKPNFIVDPLLGKSVSPLPATPTFVYTGRLSPEKGLMVLLKAWLKLNQPEWRLTILGDGPERCALEQFCQEKKLTNVSFLGYQNPFSVLQSMQTSTAVLVPSQWYETFGRVVIEAFACGRPALVSDLGALAELVEEGVTGFRIPVNDPDAWAERITWCVHNQSQLASMGIQARSAYKTKFTPQSNYQELMEIYRAVIR